MLTDCHFRLILTFSCCRKIPHVKSNCKSMKAKRSDTAWRDKISIVHCTYLHVICVEVMRMLFSWMLQNSDSEKLTLHCRIVSSCNPNLQLLQMLCKQQRIRRLLKVKKRHSVFARLFIRYTLPSKSPRLSAAGSKTTLKTMLYRALLSVATLGIRVKFSLTHLCKVRVVSLKSHGMTYFYVNIAEIWSYALNSGFKQ